jgi:hypothetical protein
MEKHVTRYSIATAERGATYSNLAWAMCTAWVNISTTPMEYAKLVSLSNIVNSLTSPGRDSLIACGKIIDENAPQLSSPMERAASSCLAETASIEDLRTCDW